MPLLIDQHTSSVTYIETMHDKSFLIFFSGHYTRLFNNQNSSDDDIPTRGRRLYRQISKEIPLESSHLKQTWHLQVRYLLELLDAPLPS